MNHREARRKLGSRSRRRANTNGKNIKGKGGGGSKRTPCYRYPRNVKRVCVEVAKLVAASLCVLLMVACEDTPRVNMTTCVPMGEFVTYTASFRSNLSGIIKTSKGEVQVTSWDRIVGMYGEPVEACHDLSGNFVTIGGRRY